MGKKSEFTKYDLYQILSTKDDLAYHLPPTGFFDDFQDVLDFIEDYKKVTLRLVDSSRERGLCIVEKLEDNFRITDCRKSRNASMKLSTIEELRSFLKGTENNFNEYIIQKLIKSAKIEQSIFDIRVVMKKDSKGDWKCGELEYTVGGKSFLLTNVNKEAYIDLLSEEIKRAYPLKFDFLKSIKDVKKLCGRTCEAVSDNIEWDCDMEFKLAIDEDNKLWFIEINLFEAMKKFKVVDYSTYLSLKRIPLLYSTQLYKFASI
jgi:hypothetical protein